MIQFLASLPPIQSAIRIAGDGGGRIQLDFPDTELPEVLKLTLLRGEIIKVTVEGENEI